VQRTLFEVGEAFLKAVSSVRRVELKLPNVHFLGLDLAKVGRPDQTRVFLPTDEPHGQIEAVVGR
jgi:urate oxidase